MNLSNFSTVMAGQREAKRSVSGPSMISLTGSGVWMAGTRCAFGAGGPAMTNLGPVIQPIPKRP